MAIQENEIVEHLSSISEKKLLELLYDCFKKRAPKKDFGDGDFELEHMCIACISYGKFGGVLDKTPLVELAALPVANMKIATCELVTPHRNWRPSKFRRASNNRRPSKIKGSKNWRPSKISLAGPPNWRPSKNRRPSNFWRVSPRNQISLYQGHE